MSVIFNKKEIKAIFYNGNEIVQGWYNHNKVWEKVVGLFITGTVGDTRYVPRVYVNSRNTTATSPSGGTWVDTTLDVENKTWKVDLSDRLPLTGMSFMFYIANSSSDRNRYIEKIVFPSNIDTSNVTSMRDMFYSNSTTYTSLASIEGLENFDTANVTNMYYMFYNCNKLTSVGDISSWDTHNVTNMRSMFYNCSSLTSVGDLSTWDTTKVTDMGLMFSGCRSLTSVGDLSTWDTHNVTNMRSMFYNCSSLTSLNLSNWNTGAVTDIGQMFSGCSSLTSVGDISSWDTHNVTNMSEMFRACSSLTSLNLSTWDTTKVTNMSGMFNDCRALTEIKGLNNLVTSSVKDISGILYDSNIKTIDVSGWDTSGVQYFGATSAAQTSLFGNVNGRLQSGVEEIIGLENFDFSSAISIGDMFHDCGKLKSVSGIENWHFANTLNVSLGYCTQNIFHGCYALKEINIRNWNTENWRVFYGLIVECPNLETLHLCPIGDGTHPVTFTNWLINCGKLANIPEAGPIYNTIIFSWCPLTLDSAKVILNALQAPYSGAQSLTFRTSTVNLIQQDQEALGLVVEKVALGWTINVALPETIFRVNAGSVQDGLTVTQFPSGTQVTEYESGKYYQITACTADTVDFSGRDVKTELHLDYPSINTIDVSDNSNLTKLVFNHENTNDMTIKFYNTGIDTDWAETINDLASKNIERSVTLYFGSKLNIGGYQYEADGPVENAYVVFTFNADGTYTDDWYGCKKYELEEKGNLVTLDDTQWIESTYAKPSDVPSELCPMYMSDSNWHKGNQMAKAHFNIPQGIEKVDLYINSFGESGYDYTIAFSLDTDWTSTSLPAYNSTGVIGNTYAFSKDPSGSIATNYKKVSYTIPVDDQDHKILVIYRKDSSVDAAYDRGFVIVSASAPAKIEIPKPEPAKKATVSGTVTDTSKTPKIYVNSSNTSASTPTGGTYVDTTLDGNSWSLDLTPYEPLTGTAFMFWNNGKDTDSKQFIDTIVFPEKINSSNMTSMRQMFKFRYVIGSGSSPIITSIEGLENFDTANVTDMSLMFQTCNSLSRISDISNWDTHNVTNMSEMFRSCFVLTDLSGITNWDVSNVRDMNNMFTYCSALTQLNLSNWDTHNVTNMSSMFRACSSLTSIGDLSNWNVGNVTSMGSMFSGCDALTSVGDLSNWNVGNVTSMAYMFSGCDALTSIDLSNWNASNLTDMDEMFYDCFSLETVNLSNADLSNVTNMYGMFRDCYNLREVNMEGCVLSNVTEMWLIFGECNSLTTLYMPGIGDGSHDTGVFAITFDDFRVKSVLANIPSAGPIYNNVDFSNCPLTIESAKVVLNALQEPYSGAQSLSLSSSTMALILADPEAQSIAQEKAALGWTISA